MSENKQTRREFIAQNATLAAATALGVAAAPSLGAVAENAKPAILGGEPLATDSGPAWPIFVGDEEERLAQVFRSRQWGRAWNPNCVVDQFENEFAKIMGSTYGIAVSSGTAALTTALAALDIGPGDEVITTPYTYAATYNSVLWHWALPVFADVDLETFQVDPKSMASRVTENTRALLPVHIGGAPADLDGILKLGEDRDIPVVEDACQAHLAEWRGKKLGSLGLVGCFSMQITKHLAGGEGGAVITDDADFAYRMMEAHSHGYLPHSGAPLEECKGVRATNSRLTAFQAAIMTAQFPKLVGEASTRNENALYLASLLAEIPGVVPQKVYKQGRSAWHLMMSRVVEEEFGLNADEFVQAMQAEGVPFMRGYRNCDLTGYVRKIFNARAGRRVYSKKKLDDWAEATSLPNFEKVGNEGVWLYQSQFLASKEAMDAIADAVRRVRRFAPEIKKALS